MARARIEYQFGQLVEIEETESEEVENVKNKFKEYGINVPLLAGKILFISLTAFGFKLTSDMKHN